MPEAAPGKFTQHLDEVGDLRRESGDRQQLRVLLAGSGDAGQRGGFLQPLVGVPGGRQRRVIVDQIGQLAPVFAQGAVRGEQRVAIGHGTQPWRPCRRQHLRDRVVSDAANADIRRQADFQLLAKRAEAELDARLLLQLLQHVTAVALLQPAPQVAGDFLQQVVAGQQIAQHKGRATGKRMIRQHAPAQAVQRADRRHVELGQGEAQASQIVCL